MEYTLIYGIANRQWPSHPLRSYRSSSHDINELINLALAEPDRYDFCYIRLPSQPSGITVWTPELGYIEKETQ